MKQNLLKKWLMTGAFIFFVLFASSTRSQSIKRQCISAYGSVINADNFLLSQTAGQSYNTSGVAQQTTIILQGFQQPNTYSIDDVEYSSLLLIDISVYPNPAINSFTISSAIEIENANLEIFDAGGKQILFEDAIMLLEHSINCSEWSKGVYLITISDSNQNKKTLQIIISK